MSQHGAGYGYLYRGTGGTPQERQEFNELYASPLNWQMMQMDGPPADAHPQEDNTEPRMQWSPDQAKCEQLPNTHNGSGPRDQCGPQFQIQDQRPDSQESQTISAHQSDVIQAGYWPQFSTAPQPHLSSGIYPQVQNAATESSPYVNFLPQNTALQSLVPEPYIWTTLTSSASPTNPSSYASTVDRRSQMSWNLSGNSSNRYSMNPQTQYATCSGRRYSMASGSAGNPRISRESLQGSNKKPKVHHHNAEEPLNTGEHRRDLSPNKDPDTVQSHFLASSVGSNARRVRRESRNRSSHRQQIRANRHPSFNNWVDRACDLWIETRMQTDNLGSVYPSDDDVNAICRVAGTANGEYIRDYITSRVAGPRMGTLPIVGTEPANTIDSERRDATSDRVTVAWDHLKMCHDKNCDEVKGKNHTENLDSPLQCLRIHNGVLCPRSFKDKDSWLKHLKITEPQIVSVCSKCGKAMTSHFFEHYRSHVNQGEMRDHEIQHYKENDIVITSPPFTRQCRWCRILFHDWSDFHHDIYKHFTNDQMTMYQWYYELEPSDTEGSDVERLPFHSRHRPDDSDNDGEGDDDYPPKGQGRRGRRNKRPVNSRSSRRAGGVRQSQRRNPQPQEHGGAQFQNCRAQTWPVIYSKEDRPRIQCSGGRCTRSSSTRRSRSLDSLDRLAVRDLDLLQIGSGLITADVQDSHESRSANPYPDQPSDANPPSSPEATSDSGYTSGVEAHFKSCEKDSESKRAPSANVCKSPVGPGTSLGCPFLSQIIAHCIKGPWSKRPTGPRTFIVVAGEFQLAPLAEDMAKRRRLWVLWTSIWPDVKWPKAYGDFVFLRSAEHRQLQKHENMTHWFKNAVPQL